MSATSSEASRATLTVTAKGVKKAPIIPPINASGANTTMVVSVDAVIAPATSRVALNAASRRRSPC